MDKVQAVGSEIQKMVSSLSWADYLLLVGMIRGALVGYCDGVVKEVLRLFLYLVTLGVLLTFSPGAADLLTTNTILGPEISKGIVAGAILLLAYSVLKLIVDLILKWAKLENVLWMKAAGAVLGMARWAYLISCVFWMVQQAGAADLLTDIQVESRWAQKVAPVAPAVIDFVSGVVPKVRMSGI
jgi:uncharacterized membrane protein required for colicin V production